jgi:peptidoglycan/LPS O-acetylase OafA/YrhL
MSRQDSILAMEKGHYWEDLTPSPPSTQSFTSRALNQAIDILRPAILTRTPSNSSTRAPVRRTAYLDGLRGCAALLDYWGHHQLWARDSIHVDKIFENGFGYEGNYYFCTIPVIRLLFSGGHFSVCVFFVISGYVLSAKPLQLIQAGEHLKLGENLSSSLFRRWLRLHIPMIVVTFCYMTSWHAFGLWTAEAEHMSSWREEVWKWYCEIKNFTFAFRSGGEPVSSIFNFLFLFPLLFYYGYCLVLETVRFITEGCSFDLGFDSLSRVP